jgi:hypothetical protein
LETAAASTAIAALSTAHTISGGLQLCGNRPVGIDHCVHAAEPRSEVARHTDKVGTDKVACEAARYARCAVGSTSTIMHWKKSVPRAASPRLICSSTPASAHDCANLPAACTTCSAGTPTASASVTCGANGSLPHSTPRRRIVLERWSCSGVPAAGSRLTAKRLSCRGVAAAATGAGRIPLRCISHLRPSGPPTVPAAGRAAENAEYAAFVFGSRSVRCGMMPLALHRKLAASHGSAPPWLPVSFTQSQIAPCTRGKLPGVTQCDQRSAVRRWMC